MFHHICQYWPTARQLLIYCGAGNNGGDGYVIAALARQAGWAVQLVQVGDLARATPETQRAVRFASDAGVVVVSWRDYVTAGSAGSAGEAEGLSQSGSGVIVDALLGTRLHGALRGDYAHAVDMINASSWPVMAADVPSGLSSDYGTVESCAVRAALTVTVVGRKPGLYTGVAADYVGRLVFEPLADADEWQQASCDQVQPCARLVTADLLSEWVPARARTAHKGHYGQVLVVGGDVGMGGAAILAAQAAARTGAGKTVLMSRAEHLPVMLVRQPEVMTIAVADARAESAAIAAQVRAATVVVLGPGLGQSAWSRTLFDAVIKEAVHASVPLVLDADALNLLAEDLVGKGRGGKLAGAELSGAELSEATLAELDKASRARWILTPHPGEAARLLGKTTAEIQSDRYHAVRQLQQLTGANCLLKGAGSLMAFSELASKLASKPSRQSIAPLAGLVDVCADGNPGMASGGMGDVLAGIAGGLLAQGLSAADALRAAVCAHARAADLAVVQQGEQGLLASDLLPELTRLWSELDSAPRSSAPGY